jgi:hypothetical protein
MALNMDRRVSGSLDFSLNVPTILKAVSLLSSSECRACCRTTGINSLEYLLRSKLTVFRTYSIDCSTISGFLFSIFVHDGTTMLLKSLWPRFKKRGLKASVAAFGGRSFELKMVLTYKSRSTGWKAVATAYQKSMKIYKASRKKTDSDHIIA